ncbi:MAG: hypothetical protein V7784_16675 [Oceanospirillaceae bacterium]
MKIKQNSAWSKDETFQYLDKTIIPIRVSCIDTDGHPIICSVWFIHLDGILWSASHKGVHIIKALANATKVAFEVANNKYPCHRVRG